MYIIYTIIHEKSLNLDSVISSRRVAECRDAIYRVHRDSSLSNRYHPLFMPDYPDHRFCLDIGDIQREITLLGVSLLVKQFDGKHIILYAA